MKVVVRAKRAQLFVIYYSYELLTFTVASVTVTWLTEEGEIIRGGQVFFFMNQLYTITIEVSSNT